MIREQTHSVAVEPTVPIVVEQSVVQTAEVSVAPRHAYQPEPINGNLERQGMTVPPVTYEEHTLMVGRVPVLPVFSHRRFSNPTLFAEEDLARPGRVYDQLAEHPVVTEIAPQPAVKEISPTAVEPHAAPELVIDEREIIDKLDRTIDRLKHDEGADKGLVSIGDRILAELRIARPGAHSDERPYFEANRRNRLKDALGLLSALQSVS